MPVDGSLLIMISCSLVIVLSVIPEPQPTTRLIALPPIPAGRGVCTSSVITFTPSALVARTVVALAESVQLKPVAQRHFVKQRSMVCLAVVPNVVLN